MAIRSGEETLAAIGVGGVPGSVLDEVCAQAGAAKVQERVNALSVPKPRASIHNAVTQRNEASSPRGVVGCICPQGGTDRRGASLGAFRGGAR